mmetsp:Transcript_2734/g.5589  ORF Transcript_2734/g.5589 Transcript_2734/m.5589 type:complete len:271 (-) Transcript_2734:235-1047(-)
MLLLKFPLVLLLLLLLPQNNPAAKRRPNRTRRNETTRPKLLLLRWFPLPPKKKRASVPNERNSKAADDDDATIAAVDPTPTKKAKGVHNEEKKRKPSATPTNGAGKKTAKKRKKGTKNTKKVKQRDQRTDLVPGAALEGLIANLNRSSGLARIIFGGFEGFQIGGVSAVSGGIGNPSARTSFSTANRSDDDSEDDDSPMAAFMRALHGGPGATGIRMSTTVVRPMTVTARFTTTSSRSYARNVHDSTAGNGAENPLEIDDDSVDEVIEID